MIDQYVDKQSQEERQNILDKAILLACQKIIQHEVHDKATSSYINSVSSLVSQLLTQIVARDLVSFAKHAGRKEITVDDVILLSRKMPNTYLHLKEFKEKQLGLGPKPTKSRSNKKLI